MLKRIAVAGLVGAITIDVYLAVLHAYIFKDATVVQLLDWDASNALGMIAFKEGVSVIWLGLAMHLCVSMVWAAVYALAATRVAFLRTRPILSGIAFGIFVMLFMRYLIVPLGHAPQITATGIFLLSNAVAHTVFFGIPVAWLARGGGQPDAVRKIA
jgi:uncharacterized membrane protein YagU involved in acid resistance